VKILYVCQYFPPEMGAPAARAVELARHWVRAGHDVTVLTGFPNHPTGVVPPEWRPRLRNLVDHETVEGIHVVRTWLLPLPNRRSYERILNYTSFALSAALRGTELRRPDVVIATSPQLLVGLAGWWIALWQRAPFVFEVRDLWPESLSAVGMGVEHSLLHRGLGWIAGFLYRKADRIVPVTAAFKTHLMRHWQVPAGRIDVIENGVESELFLPQDSERAAVRRELGLERKFVVAYIGTLGMAHGLDTLIEAATHLQSANPAVAFLLVGEGADKERILALARRHNLQNLRAVGQQPRERMPAFISAADACAVLLKKTELFKTVVPTKMLEFMSCARPVLLGVDGQARQLLEEAQGGIFLEPENAGALVNAIARLAADPAVGHGLGENGRNYVLAHCSRDRTAAEYIGVLNDVIAKARSGGSHRRAGTAP
jgi:glycosyltransferase involved in cell wall biosynthesis